MTPSRAATRQRLQKVTHYATAFVLALKGLSKLEHPEGYWGFIGLCWGGAGFILLVTILHDRLHTRFPNLDVSVYLVEAAVCASVAYLTFAEGARAQWAVWGLAAAGYLIAATMALQKREVGTVH